MSSLKRKAGNTPTNDAKKPKQQGTLTSFFGAPKITPSKTSTNGSGPVSVTATTATPKFDKQKWVDGLSPEKRELLKLEIETLHESWLAHLKDDVTSESFLELKRFIKREREGGKKIFPPEEDVYSWSRHTPFSTVKVVILGQDPYHNHNQAHGLAFSVRPPTPAPPSLKNMYIALRKDYPAFAPPPKNSGLLTPWADRGVLLLNTCLTVRAHEANSHSNRGWEKFTQRCLELVAARRTGGVVFMAWGTPAGKRVTGVDGKRHLVLRSVHPSPLSASRGFFDCGHFRKANEWLVGRYGDEGEIDWSLTPGTSTVVKVQKEVEDAVKALEEDEEALAALAEEDDLLEEDVKKTEKNGVENGVKQADEEAEAKVTEDKIAEEKENVEEKAQNGRRSSSRNKANGVNGKA